MSDPVIDSIREYDERERIGKELSRRRYDHVEMVLENEKEMTELLRDYCEILAPFIIRIVKRPNGTWDKILIDKLSKCAMKDAMNIYTDGEDLDGPI